MQVTAVLGLKKPESTDAVKLADFNFNWDALDAHGHDVSKITGIMPVIKGGTGGGDAATARANLGANDAVNITTGVFSTDRLPTVPLAKGGTGATDAATARANLGAAANANATVSVAGLLSAADKAKLDGVAANANNYAHPTSGVTAGTYNKVTVNTAGHVTAGDSSPMPIADGGTGSNTAAAARSALGVPAVNHASATTENGIASASMYGHALASSATPLVAGTANVGADNGKFAREGHIHPAQTAITGNAGTASKLQTPRTINGAAFDGSANIAFGTLTPTDIAASTDLNTLQTAGFFKCDQNANVATLTNAPTTNAFFMIVGQHAGVFQQITEYLTTAPKTYMRNMVSGTWGSWYRVFTTVDAPTSISGNAGTATALATARSFSLTGGVTASAVTFNGSANVALNVTAIDVSKANAGVLSIARGGTGAGTAADALATLGAVPLSGGVMSGGLTIGNGAANASLPLTLKRLSSGSILTVAELVPTADGTVILRSKSGGDTDAYEVNRLTLGASYTSLQKPLTVASGGTGATTAAGIRNTLGLGNTTGAVPVANGGTGAITPAAALANLGIFYAATLPETGVEGQICLVPIS